MRMLLEVEFPVEPFNSMVRDGTVGQKIQEILGELKPEAAYFTERDGHRGGILVVDVADPSRVPQLAERCLARARPVRPGHGDHGPVRDIGRPAVPNLAWQAEFRSGSE